MTYNIDDELLHKYHEIKAKHPNIDNDMVMMFAEEMPEEFEEALMEYEYGCHIATKKMYDHAVSYFVNPDGHKGANWEIDVIKNKAGIDFNTKEYTLWDFAYMVNMHYSDYGEKITTDLIFWMAKKDLEDKDYYGDASERAYKDAKKRIKYFSNN